MFKRSIHTFRIIAHIGIGLLCFIWPTFNHANEANTIAYFEKVKPKPTLLREFLLAFPKGGDIHSHIDGAVYAESMINWASEDGRCIDLASMTLSVAPCDVENNRPSVASIENDSEIVEQIIDAFSTRNYQQNGKSGSAQFFSTFSKFYAASFGREGDMLDEVTRRAANQNVLYLELMQSWNMSDARNSASNLDHQAQLISQAAVKTASLIDKAEAKRKELQRCDTDDAMKACKVKVRYLAQILRTFSRDKVRAQTKLAVQQIIKDSRVVGLNFVAPEHHPITLKDHNWQMNMIAEETAIIDESKRNISLHAGELSLSVAPQEALGVHIRQAIEIAEAKRIGHAVDIRHDSQPKQLLARMAKQGIAVEINLTSNEVILGITGDAHPFDLFQDHRVPLTISTDDEGVSRIDLTNEYQRAVETYNLSYKDLKRLARNALQYSFLEGESLFVEHQSGLIRAECRSSKQLDSQCEAFLNANAKAKAQWQHEQSLIQFENRH